MEYLFIRLLKKKKQQVFFRAGVLGQMEELRDERLSKIVSWMQAYIRGYLSRKEYKKLQDQRLALVVVQRNLRKYLQIRTWPWWKLWQKVKPLLNVTRIEDELAVSVPTKYFTLLLFFFAFNRTSFGRILIQFPTNLFSLFLSLLKLLIKPNIFLLEFQIYIVQSFL